MTGVVYFMGSSFADATNLLRLPGAWIGKFGAASVGSRPTVLRLHDNNSANESDWLSGTFTGDLRRVAFSLLTQL
jgi:hypothetical protein